MLTLKQKSKTSPRTTVFLFAVLLTLAATALVRPAAGLAAPGEPVLGFEPGSHDFGLQPIHDSAHASFQLRNEGAEEAWIESLQTVGPDSHAFWVGNTDCWSGPLQPGSACSLEVGFNPHEPFAEYAAQVRATSNGFEFYADVSGSGASPYFISEPNPVDFGVAAVEGKGSTREIEVVNAGNWPGGVFIAVISGGAVGSFQLIDENCTNRLIAPSEGCTAQVRFQPSSTGVKRATLSLFGESDGGSQVTLTGVGSAPEPVSPPAQPIPPAATGAAIAGAPAARPSRTRYRARIRALKHRLQVQRKRRVQRRLRLQRRQRVLRRHRALRRHGRHNRAGLRSRRSIGG